MKNTYNNLWVEICFTTLNKKKEKDPKSSLNSLVTLMISMQ